MNKKVIIIAAIFLLGFFMRFYNLGEVPLGFHRDEAFLGYNAYSILKTGKDISGNFLPLHLQSFLYSPAGYSYFSIPFIYVFGLSAFSVRFASAFFASLSILVCYFICLELFFENKNKYLISITSSFLMSISAWNINLAKTATESSIVVFFISLGTLAFLIGVRRRRILVQVLSMVFFSITLFVYQAPRAFLPLFLPIIFIFYIKKIGNLKNKSMLLFIFCLLIILPTLSVIFSKELSLRIRTLSVFSNTYSQSVLKEYISADGVEGVPPLFARIFHNKFISYSSQISQNYFKHFSYDFLFTDSGFPDRYRVPSMGLLYIFELPLLLLGLIKVLKDKSREGFFLLVWILLAPVGAALTFDDIPNLQRTLLIFPALSILEGIGFMNLFEFLEKFSFRKYLYLIIIIFISFSFAFYVHQYFVHFNRYRTWYRQDGYENLVKEVNNLLPRYKKAVIANTQSAPSIFFLFYSQYNPSVFQKETANLDKNLSDSTNFYKYNFVDEECPSDSSKTDILYQEIKDVLYVDDGNCKVTAKSKVIATIYRHDGSVAFRVMEKKTQ